MIRKFCVLSLTILIISGCSPLKSSVRNHPLQEQMDLLQQMEGYKLLEAYGDDYQVCIKFQAFSPETDQVHVFYAYGLWDYLIAQNTIDHIPQVKLELLDEHKWVKKKTGLREIAVLPPSQWDDFQQLLTEALAPKDAQDVNQISLGGQTLYLTRKGKRVHVTHAWEEGSDKNIQAVTDAQYTQIFFQSLSDYLLENNKRLERAIFTKPVSDQLSPFIHVDRSQGRVIMLNLPLGHQEQYKENILSKGMKSADYLFMNSYVWGLATRPVSYSMRLLNWTKDTTLSTYDAIVPDLERLSLPKEIPAIDPQTQTMDRSAWESELDKMLPDPPSFGTIDFLIGGDAFYPALIESLVNTKKSVDFRIFIFDNDDYAVKIADILKKVSQDKNISVRVLLDSMGIVMGEGKLPDTLPPGYVPPKSMVDYLRKDSNVDVRVRPNAIFKADHIKTIIIDEKICYTGGMNIGREYRYDWHDLMMKLEGAVVQDIRKAFDLAWEHASKLGDISFISELLKPEVKNSSEEGYPIRLLYTRANDSQIYRTQLEAIKRSQKYIYISNAYFSDNEILYELIKARRRGVDVRVILPVHGNHDIMNKSNMIAANIMYKNGIRVFFYPGMSHVKAAIYDGWLCTGSANFDRLSLKDNLELNVATSHPPAVERLKQTLFDVDFDRSTEMDGLIKTSLENFFADILADQL
ncbi:MAG: phosphatidylserine/phosphatidylglycerophosphate/cardiolipin synthase family protein [Candidatus Omnitrophica bacterium]|nr:phosphatidylserine/phosphatidylglycerophosphate/cardiolipin synthase family protein [Candidatus Omnitrophota bacterium]